jgi:protein-tyrosine-phosphatase
MYEGKPLVLLIGGSDTGRTPMAAGVLRRALGAGVVVRTAGVVSHEGEGAMPEAQMALDQVGIDISRHISRPLRHEEHRNADLMLAVDRGTEMVLFSEFPSDPRVACLSVLANMPDVLDPHRMPLGVWVTALRQLSDQINAALPQIRERLGIAGQEPLETLPRKVERRKSASAHEPLVLGTGHKMQWDRDEDMQRLLNLIETGHADDDAAPQTSLDVSDQGMDQVASNAELGLTDEPEQQAHDDASRESIVLDAATDQSEPATAPHDSSEVPSRQQPVVVGNPHVQPSAPQADRATHVARIIKMLETAEEMPEVVDWSRMLQEIINRLRAIAQQSSGPLDFVPAATLMIEGKLMQHKNKLSIDGLYMLRGSIKRLEAPLNATGLATIGGELAEW